MRVQTLKTNVRKLARVWLPTGREYWASIEGDRVQPLLGEANTELLARFFSGESLPPACPSLPLASAQWRAPLPVGAAVYGVGLNYRKHAQEVSGEPDSDPVFFLKAPGSVGANGGSLSLSPISDTLDYEGELAVIIGQSCHDVAAEEALASVAGYAVANDGTLRAYARPETLLLAKSTPGNTIIGPWITQLPVTGQPQLDLRCWINGELRQQANTRDMIRGVAELVASLSKFVALRVGDVILTGSPAGVGAGQNPPQYLRCGDHVRIEIECLGAINTTVDST